jgi:hypothetical protein
VRLRPSAVVAMTACVVIMLLGVGGAGTLAEDLAVVAPEDRQQLLLEMDTMLAMPLGEFLELREDRAGRAGSAIFDWSSDGCTSFIPVPGRFLQARFKMFAPACVRHDWGYRNFGSVNIRGFDANEERRRAVDERMRSDMFEICEREEPDSMRCRIDAMLVHRGVRLGGHLSFYGFFE